MNKLIPHRRRKLFYAAAFIFALSALVILTLSITQAEFNPGTMFFSEQSSGRKLPPSTIIQPQFQELFVPTWIIALLILVPVILYILIIIFVPSARKYSLRNILIIVVWAVCVYFLYIQESETIVTEELVETPTPLPLDEFTIEMPDVAQAPIPQIDPSSPNWVSFIIAFSVILIILIIAYVYYRRRMYLQNQEDDEVEEIAAEAESALNEIYAGIDLRNTILRCYLEMSNILSMDKGIERKRWMTPREFEHRLVRVGFPKEPVKTLTQLFEFVRYGAQEPDKVQETQAIQSLSAIAKLSSRK